MNQDNCIDVDELEVDEAAVAGCRIVKAGDIVEIDSKQVTDPAFIEHWQQKGPYIVAKIVMMKGEDFLYLAREKCKDCDHCSPSRMRARIFK